MRSFVIGDKVSDLLPGIQLGCRTILVCTGYGKSFLDAGALHHVTIDYVADTLHDAADWILGQTGLGSAPTIAVCDM